MGIDLLSQDELDEEYQYLLDDEAMGEINLLCGMANNPEVLQSYMRYGSTLWDHSGLEPEEVEILILSVASAMDVEYEWQQHVPIALEMGISEDTIQSIRREEFDRFSNRRQSIVQYAIAVANGGDTDTEREKLGEYADQGTLVGTTLLATHYLATARFVDSLSIPLDGPFIGWDLEDLD